MSGPRWPGGEVTGALQSHEEVASLQRVFSACQSVLERPEGTVENLLDSVRDCIRADELFLIARRGALMEVLSSPTSSLGGRPHIIPVQIPPRTEWGLDEEALRQLAVSLGASSRALAGGYGADVAGLELVVAGWATGPALSPISMTVVARALSTARAALRTRRSAVNTLVGKERDRIAYALHDGLTQTVTGAVLELEALARRIERDPREAIDALEGSKREIRRALAELRAMLMDLSGDGQQTPRSAEVLRQEVDDVVRRWRLPARIQVDGDLELVPGRILSAAYVVIREALANAAKYAPGSNITVVLAAGATDLTVMVGDEGAGFTRGDEMSARESRHFGLDWLRRRVREAGGRLYVHPRPGKGTRVVARFPLHEAAS
jgi:signal transduction histidine kinase